MLTGDGEREGATVPTTGGASCAAARFSKPGGITGIPLDPFGKNEMGGRVGAGKRVGALVLPPRPRPRPTGPPRRAILAGPWRGPVGVLLGSGLFLSGMGELDIDIGVCCGRIGRCGLEGRGRGMCGCP